MTRITRGDKNLLNSVESWKDLSHAPLEPHYETLFTQMAFVWDAYGLADESVNPTSRFAASRGSASHVTRVPRPEDINEAMNHRLRSVLAESDYWMLDIPRQLVPGKANTDLIVSKSGGAAIAMPMAGFGTLFRWNEQAAIALSRSGSSPHSRDGIDPGLVRINAYLFTGGDLLGRDEQLRLSALLLGLDGWVYRDGRTLRRTIWKYTIFQQCLMILHEFAHIRLINLGLEANRDPGGRHIVSNTGQRAWNSLQNELMADALSAEWVLRLARSFAGDPEANDTSASIALLLYFTLLDMVSEVHGHRTPSWVLSLRFLYLLQDLGKSDSYPQYRDALDDIAAAVGGRTRGHFLSHDYRCQVDHAVAVSLSPEADRLSRETWGAAPIIDAFRSVRQRMGVLLS